MIKKISSNQIDRKTIFQLMKQSENISKVAALVQISFNSQILVEKHREIKALEDQHTSYMNVGLWMQKFSIRVTPPTEMKEVDSIEGIQSRLQRFRSELGLQEEHYQMLSFFIGKENSLFDRFVAHFMKEVQVRCGFLKLFVIFFLG